MCAITKPMLAGKCEQPEELRFPVLATPKLDGIRRRRKSCRFPLRQEVAVAEN